MDILEEIVAYKRQEIEQLQSERPLAHLEREVMPLLDTPVASMSQALAASPTGIIAEFKRRSPSKGWIKEEGRPDVIPLAYQQAGATALSILTDTHYFGGEDAFITTARTSGVILPILYKNFVITPYQLFQARRCGASAVLLIAACLTRQQARDLCRLAHDLGLEVLLETHALPEMEYADIAPDMVGVNNRHLGTFHTDVQTSFDLARYMPDDVVRVSESGLSAPHTVQLLRQAGYRGFLMGEHFMRSPQPGQELSQFLAALC